MSDTQIYSIYIDTPAQQIWDAITSSEFTTKYGYAGAVDIDLTPGGQFRHHATESMKAMNMPDIVVEGEIVELDAPRRLVQFWNPVWLDGPATRLTWEITEFPDGPSLLTLSHEVDSGSELARQVAGGDNPGTGGGGWPWVLASMKTLLETGKPMTGVA